MLFMTQNDSQKIKNMSFLCAVLVVFIHIEWPLSCRLSPGWLLYHLFNTGVSAIAVPYFFVVSGFFVAKHFDENQWWRREIGKRVRSLVVPFYIWNFIFFLITNLIPIVADLIANRPLGANVSHDEYNYWLRLLGVDLFQSPLLWPLWYLRCLFFFVLISPLFKFMVEKFSWGWLLVMFALWLIHNHISNEDVRNFFYKSCSFFGAFFFSCGIYIRRLSYSLSCNPVDNKLLNFWKSRVFAIASLVLGLVLLILKCVLSFGAYPMQTFVGKMFIPFMMYGIWYFIPAVQIPSWLTRCSFPLYLLHVIFIVLCGVLVRPFSFTVVQKALIALSIGVLGSILTAVLLRRFTPKFASVAFGGR